MDEPDSPADAADGDLRHELRSFGRRRGRKLSGRQQDLVDGLLPRLRLDLAQPPPSPLTALFASPVTQVWLEIGFGGGEHLLWQAAAHPHAGIIGCEPFVDGVVKVLAGVDAAQHGNVRVHDDDARDVLRWLPPAALSRAFVLFADPWPKRRHQKRRLVNEHTLDLLAHAMAPGAELRIATDIPDYLRSMFVALRSRRSHFTWTAREPADWRQRHADWPPTRYEAKAEREGRKCCFLTLIRN